MPSRRSAGRDPASQRRTGHPVRDVRADAARRAAAVVRAARDDRGAPRSEPGCRAGGRIASTTTGGRSSRRRRRDSARRSCRRSSASAPSSTTSAGFSTIGAGDDDRRRHLGMAGPVVVPLGRRARPLRAGAADAGQGFFAACGMHFWRFLRLGIVAFLIYDLLFAWVHPLLFDWLYPRLTRDLDGRTDGVCDQARLLSSCSGRCWC